jgi:hypothetical protein
MNFISFFTPSENPPLEGWTYKIRDENFQQVIKGYFGRVG